MGVFKSVKGRVAGVIMVGALVTGAGAAAASQFSDVMGPAIDGLANKAAAYVGFEVNKNAESKEDAIEAKVQSEFNTAAGAAINHAGSEITRGNNEVNGYASGYQTDIENAADTYLEIAKTKMTNAANDEVFEAKGEIHAAATAKANALIAPFVNASVPSQPAE
jgi:hypothetical protein